METVDQEVAEGIKKNIHIELLDPETKNISKYLERPEVEEKFLTDLFISSEALKENTSLSEEDEKVKQASLKDLTEFLDSHHYEKQAFHWGTERDKKYISILSLDGGGFRGYMQALWLKELESITKLPPHEIFDFIAGTSIGGILGAAAATPKQENGKILLSTPALSTQEMVDLFEKNGESIFPQRYKCNLVGRLYDGVVSLAFSRYDPTPLENMLISHFRDSRFEDTLVPIIMTAATVEKKPVLFSSLSSRTRSYQVWEAARATSAAPSYFKAFPLVLPGGTCREYLTDGGLWFNNPAQLAFQEVMQTATTGTYRDNLNNITMLSLGTGIDLPSMWLQHPNTGKVGALLPTLDTLMTSTSLGVDYSLQSTLGENYLRINPELGKKVDLDAVDEGTQAILKQVAEAQYPHSTGLL